MRADSGGSGGREATELHLDRNSGWGWTGIQEWSCALHTWSLLSSANSPSPNSVLSVRLSVSWGCSAPSSSALPLTSWPAADDFFLQGCDTRSHGMFFLSLRWTPQGEGGRIVLARELRSQRLNPRVERGDTTKTNQIRAGEGRVDSCW